MEILIPTLHFAFGWRSASSAAVRWPCESGFSRRGTYGITSPRKHRLRRLFHHRFHFSAQAAVYQRADGAIVRGSPISLSGKRNYFLHEFVLMPDHFHLLISPTLSLERSLQLIKGGFSYRARKELGFPGEVWEKSFYDRRVRGIEDYYNFKQYIRRNPVQRGLTGLSEEYPYSSAHRGFTLDKVSERVRLGLTG
jgi:REP element-mobilizing transposase RayT